MYICLLYDVLWENPAAISPCIVLDKQCKYIATYMESLKLAISFHERPKQHL